MGHQMTEAEVQAFLGRSPAPTAIVATTSADGSPHVAPVWFALDDGAIVFNTGEETLKGRHLRRDPRVAICVDDDRPPFSFATIRGTAELIDDLAEVKRWATTIGGRYMGAENAEQYGERNGVPGELLVRVRLERVTAVADLAE